MAGLGPLGGKSRDDGTRDWDTHMMYFDRDAPRGKVHVDNWGDWDGIIQGSEMKMMPAEVVDARVGPEGKGGKEAWTLEEHGFCFVDTPFWDFPSHQEHDRKKCDVEFGPLVCEVSRVAAGAKRAFWMSHQRRAEPESRRGEGPAADGYASGFGHSDYGPEFEHQFRTILVGRVSAHAIRGPLLSVHALGSICQSSSGFIDRGKNRG